MPRYSTPMQSRPEQQHGMVLILALVILMAMTIISVSSMSTSTLEERMAGNLKDREIAFQAAEAALRHGESLVDSGISTGSFNSECTNGFCDYDLQEANDFPVYWKDETLDVWNNSSRHIAFPVTGSAEDAKIIIEYMGVQIQDLSGEPQPTDPPIYRVTALGYGQTTDARVMLQSSYMKE
ncbi:pilus assembly PilX family protein [Thiohalophilus thiocyanatoxydans]|uniref:Type IV pilus assembly protein PilX n=1 Tax=Thiohalophilus thiocyanatoxydans TaxID=381308 RepID=A0A4R8IFI4_9GAMM|nr:PilX N-terminal domain-containing pilus assembly protein [Thiohalophilus thiocyanatoxydans]TDX97922.1 type IV pilus assembly protein PilX [Thiohalophilus thiocyanatoxydans]